MKILLPLCLLLGFIGSGVQAEEEIPTKELDTSYFEDSEGEFLSEENIVSIDFRENEDIENSKSMLRSNTATLNLMQIGAGGVNGGTIYLYPTKSTASKRITYVSNSSSYNADAVILDVDGDWYRIKIAGADGWINLQSGVIPRSLDDVKSVSHYIVSASNNILHNITKGVDDTKYSQINNGPAPAYMKQGITYYSFDGHYFYTNYATMISDNKAKVSTNAINPNKPYFNYFQFLPMRSESKLSSKQIDDYLTKYRGYTSLIPRKTIVNLQKHESNLFGIGEKAANLGINLGNNHGTTLGIAINESGWGRSSIAATKNNVFGHSAYDSYPGAAGAYNSVGDSFHAHNTSYLNAGYLLSSDYRYQGGYVGNKSSGVNVQYASDSYWGEKAADQYRTLDTFTKSQDYGNYQFLYKNSSNITNVSKNPNSKDVIPSMQLKNQHQIFLYLGTVSGENIKGSSNWYKIAVDSLLDDKKNIMSKSESIKDIEYDKQRQVGYVHSSEFNLTDKLKNDGEGWTFYPNTQKWAYRDNSGWAYGLKEINGYQYYFDGGGYTTSGWIKNADKHYQIEKNGTLKTGWYQENDKKYYLNPVTGIMQTHWAKIDGLWHYFNSSGTMLTGWQTINSSKYNLGHDGKMLTGWHKENNNWYYLQSSGSMSVGLTKIDSKWYHFNESGKMSVGWLNLGGKWNYFEASGSLTTGWSMIDSKYYYFDALGTMSVGWLQLGDSWYFLNNSGSMATGWQWINNSWYHLQDSGRMSTGLLNLDGDKYYLHSSGRITTGWHRLNEQWYYYQSSGRMSYGWIYASNNWYYMYENGQMAVNTTIDQYKIGPNGIML